MNNYDYPEGSDNSFAPWNEVEQDGELVEVTISQTLSKQVEVEVDDYEVDFVALNSDGRIYVQVCETLRDNENKTEG